MPACVSVFGGVEFERLDECRACGSIRTWAGHDLSRSAGSAPIWPATHQYSVSPSGIVTRGLTGERHRHKWTLISENSNKGIFCHINSVSNNALVKRMLRSEQFLDEMAARVKAGELSGRDVAMALEYSEAKSASDATRESYQRALAVARKCSDWREP